MGVLQEHRKEIITGMVIAFLLYFFLKYIFPLISPFVLAFLTIYAMYPLLYKTEEKWKVHKSVMAILLLVIGFLIVFGALFLFLYLAGSNAKSLLNGMETWKEDLVRTWNSVILFFEQKMDMNIIWIKEFINGQINNGFDSMKNTFFPDIMKNSMLCVKKILPFFAFIGIYLIATVLIAKDFDDIMIKVHKIGALDAFLSGMEGILHTIGTYLKAQLIILFVISAVCMILLKVFGIPYPFLLGLVAGILDALPFIGTGIVLVPTAIVQALGGNFIKALLCIALYIVCILLREIMEPKLMGKRLGVYPVILLLSIFAGIKLFGLSGIIKGPFAVVLFKQICKVLF